MPQGITKIENYDFIELSIIRGPSKKLKRKSIDKFTEYNGKPWWQNSPINGAEPITGELHLLTCDHHLLARFLKLFSHNNFQFWIKPIRCSEMRFHSKMYDLSEQQNTVPERCLWHLWNSFYYRSPTYFQINLAEKNQLV